MPTARPKIRMSGPSVNRPINMSASSLTLTRALGIGKFPMATLVFDHLDNGLRNRPPLITSAEKLDEGLVCIREDRGKDGWGELKARIRAEIAEFPRATGLPASQTVTGNFFCPTIEHVAGQVCRATALPKLIEIVPASRDDGCGHRQPRRTLGFG